MRLWFNFLLILFSCWVIGDAKIFDRARKAQQDSDEDESDEEVQRTKLKLKNLASGEDDDPWFDFKNHKDNVFEKKTNFAAFRKLTAQRIRDQLNERAKEKDGATKYSKSKNAVGGKKVQKKVAKESDESEEEKDKSLKKTLLIADEDDSESEEEKEKGVAKLKGKGKAEKLQKHQVVKKAIKKDEGSDESEEDKSDDQDDSEEDSDMQCDSEDCSLA